MSEARAAYEIQKQKAETTAMLKEDWVFCSLADEEQFFTDKENASEAKSFYNTTYVAVTAKEKRRRAKQIEMAALKKHKAEAAKLAEDAGGQWDMSPQDWALAME